MKNGFSEDDFFKITTISSGIALGIIIIFLFSFYGYWIGIDMGKRYVENNFDIAIKEIKNETLYKFVQNARDRGMYLPH